MKILIVEDEARKYEAIRGFIDELATDESSVMETVRASDLAAAATHLRSEAFDLLLLDLNVPRRSGEEPVAGSGVELLKRLARRSGPAPLNLPAHVVGLSAYPAEIQRQEAVFEEMAWPLVPFSFDTDGWQTVVGRKIIHILDASLSHEGGEFDCDLAIVCALTHIELESVLQLDGGWHEDLVPDDDQIYHRGTFRGGRRDVQVVACASVEMGLTAASALVSKVIGRYRPRFLAMAGIAAGIKGHFGDVLISTHAWDYGSGKIKERGVISEFLPAPSQVRVHSNLLARLQLFALDGSVARRIQDAWSDDPSPAAELTFILGGIASGASVVESVSLVDRIRNVDRKAVGVDMEGYAVLYTAAHASRPRPKAFVAKSVCDFANGDKSDDYQRYAAFTSARFIYEFALSNFGEEGSSQAGQRSTPTAQR